jgi:hypothetical protein
VRTKPNLAFGPEHGPGEGLEGSLEIRQGDVLVDDQSLHLMEHGGVGCVGVASVGAPRDDDMHGWTLLLHGPHLHGRRVRPQ